MGTKEFFELVFHRDNRSSKLVDSEWEKIKVNAKKNMCITLLNFPCTRAETNNFKDTEDQKLAFEIMKLIHYLNLRNANIVCRADGGEEIRRYPFFRYILTYA